MALNELMHFPEVVPLIPGSGIQFLDFGFSIDKQSDVPKDWGWFDTRATLNNEKVPSCVRRGDQEDGRVESYSTDLKTIEQMFNRVWMPLPLLRREAKGFYRGPTNWARAYLAKLDEPDADGHHYRLVIAADTTLLEFVESEAYLAPSPSDARNGHKFALPGPQDPVDWYFAESWVRDWCLETFKEMLEREERRRRQFSFRPLTDDEVHDQMQGSNEHLARYKAFIDLLHSLDILPAFQLVDRITEPRTPPINVDLVLDLGNSRSCGLLIESDPEQLGADITKAVKLQLRDLGCAEQVYADPFPSRFEFARAQFGRDHLSIRSGRSEAFGWPTVVRVGVEAARLAARRSGTEGSSGLSSPKRYLWDEDAPRFVALQRRRHRGRAFRLRHRRRLHDARQRPRRAAAPARRAHPRAVSRQGLPGDPGAVFAAQPDGVRAGGDLRPGDLDDEFADAPAAPPGQRQPAAPAAPHHHDDAHGDAARRAAHPRAAGTRGLDMAYLSLGLAHLQHAEDGSSRMVYTLEGRIRSDSDDAGPEVILRWDEATATQAVYLYTQVALNYSGDARAFFKSVRHPDNQQDPAAGDGFRLATVDLGGGTTDLVVTSISVDGRPGANVTLTPLQEFREGFSLAGDDALLRVVREHVVDPIRDKLRQIGMGERADYALNQLLGGDRGDMKAVELVRRQQFASQIASPIGLGLLQEYESYNPLLPVPATTRKFADFFSADSQPSAELLSYFNTELGKLGARDFKLQDMVFDISLPELDRTVRSVFQEMLQALGEIIYRYRCDILILSGRTSRLPAVRAILEESAALPSHRVLPLHLFRVGQWYPFRDFRATVGDPKTTAAVGAMVCLLGNGQLQNFNFRSDELRPRSTARYFGKLDQSNRLLKDDEFYNDLDLDNNQYELSEQAFEFRGPMPLGFRQLPVDWWPGSRLYHIDYATPDDARALNAKTPLRIMLKRASKKTTRNLHTGEEYIENPGLIIHSIKDREDKTVPPTRLRLRLQTISHQQGYWLDTGILLGS